MNYKTTSHLTEEQIIQAVIDEGDLPSSLKDHLYTCTQCSTEKERILGLLSHLGNISKTYAPVPRKRVKLPIKEISRSSQLCVWEWRRFVVAGLSVAMVIVLVWYTMPLKTPTEDQSPQLYNEMWDDYQLMTEIVRLEEHPLPQIYSDISGESSPTIDDEFIQFITPSTQDEALYHEPKEVQYNV